MNMEDTPTPFQRMRYTKGVLVPCAACGRKAVPEWDREGYCDGCREPVYPDYEEDFSDDED